MFSGVFIGFIAAASTGTWVYTKVMRRTGNNTQQAYTTAGIAAAAAFVIFLTLVWTVDAMLG